MSAYRVFVANKIESEEVQKCFFELGYKWNGVGCVLKASEKFDFPYFVKGSKLGMSFIKRKSGDNSKELSLSELREYCDKYKNHDLGFEGTGAV